MENQDIDPYEMIAALSQMIQSQGLSTKIVAAGFKNIVLCHMENKFNQDMYLVAGQLVDAE